MAKKTQKERKTKTEASPETIPLDTSVPPAVSSVQESSSQESSTGAKKMTTLTLTHKPDSRKSKRAVKFNYPDRKGGVLVLRSLFGEQIPDTFTITGDFAEPKAALTPEERKAARKALTPADRLKKAEERVARLREKLAAASAAPAEGAQPSA